MNFNRLTGLIAATYTPLTDDGGLDLDQVPSMPDELGFAGPFVGVHNDALGVARGANFPKPVWDRDKVWHERVLVLLRNGGDDFWKDGGALSRPIAYEASVSTREGVVRMGGQ